MSSFDWFIDASDAGLAAAEIWSKAALTDAAAEQVVNHYGTLLWLDVHHRASGRPGPRVVTGEYLASIGIDMSYDPSLGWSVEVGTNEERGYALEMGYLATDADGEQTVHHPFPHFRPAIAEIEEPFVVAVGNLVDML